MCLSCLISDVSVLNLPSPQGFNRGRTSAVLLVVAFMGCALVWSQSSNGGSKEPPPSPAPAVAAASSEQLDLKQTLHDLEKELDRLETASAQIDEQATELLGRPKQGQHRAVELPQEQAAMVQYLKRCLKLVEHVESEFGDLVAAEDEVDLKERIPDAHEHVKRLERTGANGMLVRRQVRLWIEKDMSAVESMNADWPAIRTSVRELIQATKRFEEGNLPLEKIAATHRTVLENATTRIRFPKSRLGVLCRQTEDAAKQLHRKRQAESAVAMQP